MDAIDCGMMATAQADGTKAKCLLNLAAARMKLEAWDQVHVKCSAACLRPAPFSASGCAGCASVRCPSSALLSAPPVAAARCWSLCLSSPLLV